MTGEHSMASKRDNVISQCGGALWVNQRNTRSYGKCMRCGRQLRSPEAQERGYGKICWKKHLVDNQQSLF